MAVIYATLIVKGKKTFAQVPDLLKEQVRQVLIDLECDHLIEGQARQNSNGSSSGFITSLTVNLVGGQEGEACQITSGY